MDLIVVAFVAFVASTVTFFSGFGLGTVLLPVFAVFLPTSAAIAATAIVHLLNSALRLGLVRHHVEGNVVMRFGLPAFAAAFLGAVALHALDGLDSLAHYRLAGSVRDVTPLNLVVAALLLGLGVQEIRPRRPGEGIPERFMPVGGLLSGFVGGLSGLQGALRSAFLIKTGLSSAGFIATGAAIALLVDTSRIIVYGVQGQLTASGQDTSVLITEIAAASVGTIIGNRFLTRVTLDVIKVIVGTALIIIAVALGMGIL